LVTIQKDQNANTSLFLTNRGSGTAQRAGYYVDNGVFELTMEVLGSSFTTSASATGNRARIITNSVPGLAIVSQNSPLSFWTNNPETEKMTILSNGNVGIGKTSPTANLEVSGDVRLNSNLHVDGNVAIGKPTPTSLLDIKAVSGDKAEIRIGGSGSFNTDNSITIGRTSSFNEFIRIGSSASGGLFGGQTNKYFIDVVGGSTVAARPIDYRFSGDSGASYSTVLSVSMNGVGIGTTATTSKFQVVGLPVYADNTTALLGGLTTGAFYRTATGVLMVVF
jgi:hypothetical protein